MIKEIDNDLFSLSDFANKMHLSEGHFRRKIKKITGLTPVKMFKTIRLNSARTYLENRTFSTIKEVAYAVGFQNGNTFSKPYKAHFGISLNNYSKALYEQ